MFALTKLLVRPPSIALLDLLDPRLMPRLHLLYKKVLDDEQCSSMFKQMAMLAKRSMALQSLLDLIVLVLQSAVWWRAVLFWEAKFMKGVGTVISASRKTTDNQDSL